MKTAFCVLLFASTHAGAIEGTVWYDAKGKVAWVDGPAAEKQTRAPFVPQWVAREERRDRALRGDYHPRGNRSCDWPVWGYGYSHAGSFRHWGTPVSCRNFPSWPFHGTRPSGGVRLIIR